MQGNSARWSIEQIVLGLLSLLVALVVCSSLLSSWSEPQVQGKLSRAQSAIWLEATLVDTASLGLPPNLALSLGSGDSLAGTIAQYQEARTTARDNWEQFDRQWQQAGQTASPNSISLDNKRRAAQRNLQQVNLELGLLQAVNHQTDAAQQLWRQIGRDLPSSSIAATADTLDRLWQAQSVPTDSADRLLQDNFQGWFRYQALSKLYAGTPDRLQALQQAEQPRAWSALNRLAGMALLRGGTVLGGLFLGLTLVGKRLGQWWQSRAPMATENRGSIAPEAGALVRAEARGSSVNRLLALSWPTTVVPWDAMVLWKVLLAFFIVGQLLLPLLLSIGANLIGWQGATAPLWQKASYVLISYSLMAAGVLAIMQILLRPFGASEAWGQWRGQGNWWLWGVGGYLLANPIVLLVSVLNEKIWQGQGGSNPILSVVLDSHDTLSFVLLTITAAVAAPLFEEYLFRGFLQPSLMRYFAPAQAIAIGGVIFALAHLSVAEVLPLATLGMILGYVYYRSQSLLATALLHSLWNGSSMLTLYLLAG